MHGVIEKNHKHYKDLAAARGQGKCRDVACLQTAGEIGQSKTLWGSAGFKFAHAAEHADVQEMFRVGRERAGIGAARESGDGARSGSAYIDFLNEKRKDHCRGGGFGREWQYLF